MSNKIQMIDNWGNVVVIDWPVKVVTVIGGGLVELERYNFREQRLERYCKVIPKGCLCIGKSFSP